MLYRVILIYFLLLVIPLDPGYFGQVLEINWLHLQYGDIFLLGHYLPRYWAGLLVVSVVLAAVWKFKDLVRWYYWVRVAVRYRLAIGIIAYGFLKLFPLQAPYPSISNLNTNYGDFTRWKLFSLSLGIVPSYESFLGGVEIVAGLLLFYRRSASVGAFILAVFLGNVFMSNLAYGGGDLLYSGYLIVLALFVLSYDAGRIFDLLILQKAARPNTYHPVLEGRFRQARLVLKGLFIFFFVFVYGVKTKVGDPYQFPTASGLRGASGVYNVTQFVLDKDTLAYSKADTLRWQDVVFENWATLSIRSNRTVVLDSNNVEQVGVKNPDYELEGSAGRHYYTYEVDSVNHVLKLVNKNPHYSSERLVLHYDRTGDGRIVLSGVGLGNTHVYAVLDRVDKKYLLEEARKNGRQRGLAL